MNAILLENMKFHAFHGVLPEEQLIGATFSVTLKLFFDFSKAAKEDNLSETVDYAEVYDLVKEEMQQRSKLIEHVAQRILDRVFLRFPLIKSAEIRLSKHNPPLGGEVEKATVMLYQKERK